MRHPLILVPLALAACAAPELPRNVPPGERDPVTVEAKFAGSEAGARQMAEFRFAKASALLSAKARERIDSALEKAAAAGALAEVMIIAWPDRDSAPVKGASLPARDQELAGQRLAAVQKYVERRVAGTKVTIHNMAEAPDAFDRLIGSSEYRLKESLRAAGIATEESGGASMAGRSLVMVMAGE